jgi:hypothetical protein
MVTVPETVLFGAGEVMVTEGLLSHLLHTVTLTPTELATSPDVAVTRAASVWDPSATWVEFHEIEYGTFVTSEPSGAPSSRNCTPETASVLDIPADTATVPLTVAPDAGEFNTILSVFTVPDATLALTAKCQICLASRPATVQD